MAKGKITLQMLSEMMASNSGRTKSSAELFVRTFFTTVKDALQRDNIIKIKGFGTFKLVVVSARESINVNNGERVNIAGYNKITFTPDKILKDRVNRAFAQFDTMVLEDEDLSIVANDDEAPVVTAPAISASLMGEKEAEPALAEEPDEPQPAPVEEPEESQPAPEEETEEPQPAPAEKPDEPKRKNRTLKIVCAVLFVLGLALGLIAALTSGNKENDAEPATKAAPDSIVLTPEQKAEQAARDSIAQLREAAKDYEQVDDGDYLIAGTRTYRKITSSHNLARYCMQIYGTKKVLPYVMKFNNLKSEYVSVGKVVKFPILVEKDAK